MSDAVLELKSLIDRYLKELEEWLADQDPKGEIDGGSVKTQLVDKTSLDILRFPCCSVRVVELKVIAVLEIEGLYTILKEDFDDNGDILRGFLASLLTKNGKIGEIESQPSLTTTDANRSAFNVGDLDLVSQGHLWSRGNAPKTVFK